MLVSFHLPKPRTKLEELATYGHHKRRLTDPGLQVPSMFNQPAHVINVRLEDVSKGLYNALKQNVSDFEKVYGKMMELVTKCSYLQQGNQLTKCILVDGTT